MLCKYLWRQISGGRYNTCMYQVWTTVICLRFVISVIRRVTALNTVREAGEMDWAWRMHQEHKKIRLIFLIHEAQSHVLFSFSRCLVHISAPLSSSLCFLLLGNACLGTLYLQELGPEARPPGVSETQSIGRWVEVAERGTRTLPWCVTKTRGRPLGSHVTQDKV